MITPWPDLAFRERPWSTSELRVVTGTKLSEQKSWTLQGLIKPIEHPGKGRESRFTFEMVFKTALAVQIVRLGVPVSEAFRLVNCQPVYSDKEETFFRIFPPASYTSELSGDYVLLSKFSNIMDVFSDGGAGRQPRTPLQRSAILIRVSPILARIVAVAEGRDDYEPAEGEGPVVDD
jgi:hypothetical protein